MPRRRMIDPSIWRDPDFAKLSVAERLLFVGIFSNADDEGRIIATPESLKADIFPYDHKFTAARVKKMRDNVIKVLKNVHLYEINHVEYIQLLVWNRYQKPSHARPSKYPPPPVIDKATEPTTFNELSKELLLKRSNEGLQEVNTEQFAPSLGQSSQVKVSIGKVGSVEKLDFKNKSNDDLTDYLTTLLKENLGRGALHGAEVVSEFWKQCIGNITDDVFQGAYSACKKYKPELLASALVKGMKYESGKHHTWKYIDKILEEKSKK